MAVALMAGLTIFAVMQRHAEQLLNKSLQSELQSRLNPTQAEIAAGLGKTTVAATRPMLIDLVQRLNSDADDTSARSLLDVNARSFLSTGLTAFSVFGQDGRELVRVGTSIQKSLLSVPLQLPGRVQLMWDGQLLILHVELEMMAAGQVVGRMVTEAPLPGITGEIKDASRLGETAEKLLCAPAGLNMQCFPTTLNPDVMTIARLASDGNPLPMAYALDGKAGFLTGLDYRSQKVAAAYAPVGDLGLGMVLKIDSADLYAPVWGQLRYLIPLLLAVVTIALLSLRWLLAPLVQRLVQSEAQAREMATSLRNSEEHFRQLFETSLESILQTRLDGQVLNANPAACAQFGMTAQEMRECKRGGLVDTSDPRLPALLVERDRTGQATGQLRMRRGDGSVFECELSSSVYLDVNQQTCANIVLRDITERKRAEERITRLNAELEQRVLERTAELEASNGQLQEFSYSVAHDLRQPFIAIGGFAGLLERSVADEGARRYISRIKDSVHQAGALTDALLAFSNLSRVPLRVQAVDISAIARSVMEALQHEDPERMASVDIQDGLVAQADPMLIKVVIQELLGNAWKFTSRRSHTEIAFRLLPAQAGTFDGEPVYVVRDNGEGFDMAYADKLFRFTQRLHSTQNFPGAGVGLANIQRIVARHGGQIWAESALDEGASFYFTLGHASRP